MKCNKCNSKVTSNFCPNCGTAVSLKKPKAKGKLLGFRSNKVWKKILSILYMVFCLIMLLSCLSGRQGKITMYDYCIKKLFQLVLSVGFITPYIFLSDTKFRQKLPLFKRYKTGASAGGMAIVLFVLMITIGIINPQHSAEYQADMANHADVIVSRTEATCTKKGEISYACDYCARTKTETIPATGHNYIETSKTEATCTKKGEISYACDYCARTKTETIPATGHNYIETSKTEATCTDKGIILSKCTACGDETKNELAALGHDMVEVSRVEATTDKDGEIVSSCQFCDYSVTEKIDKVKSNTNSDNPKEENDSTTTVSSFEECEPSADNESTETEAPIQSHFVGKEGCTYDVSATFDCDDVIYEIHSVKISSDRDSESPNYNFYKIFFDFSIKNERNTSVDWNLAYTGNLYGLLCHRGAERYLGGNSHIKDDDYISKKRMSNGTLASGQSANGYSTLVCMPDSVDNPKDTWPLYSDEPFDLELHLVVNNTDYKFKIQFNQ